MKMKNSVNFKEKNKKIINYTERGITLVALVITIIILLILTGVTLNTALSDNGLFQKAKVAGEKYKDAEKQEQSTLEGITEEIDKISIDYNDYVGAIVTGYDIIKKAEGNEFVLKGETLGLNSNKDENNNTINGVETNGDQKLKTEELGWRIWDYDKYTKTVRLISSKPTIQKLTLNGATGYNNGVYAINEVCRQCYGQYDENNHMKRGITVANLRRTDIQKVSTYDYTQYKHEPDTWQEVIEEKDGLLHFGESKTYDNGNNKYPKMWGDYDSKWTYEYSGGTQTGSDKECEIWERENGYEIKNETGTGDSDTEFKQSYYAHDYKDNKSEFINEKYYNLLFNDDGTENPINGEYWLAGRYAIQFPVWCAFGVQRVSANKSLVDGVGLYNSNTGWASKSNALRPIVSINLISSGYSLEKVVGEDNEVSFKLVTDKS